MLITILTRQQKGGKMTDKQIIIDGVDVAGCEDYGYRGKARYWCHNYDEPCTDYPNCYYKQLKAKEQECEELKHEVELMMDCESCKIDEYKQTLTEIKDMCSEINCESLMQNYWCGNTDFKMGCCEKLFKKQILQKISGVENE